jgi:NitT/TauT family transport system permease protein
MMSMSGAWFFVVAAEAISVGKTSITLPGVGSYVSLAIEKQNLPAIGWAIAVMLIVILIYDQLLFRPLVAWSEKFRVELTSASGPPPRSWLLEIAQRARLAQLAFNPLFALGRRIVRLRFRALSPAPRGVTTVVSQAWSSRWMDVAWAGLVVALSLSAAWFGVAFMATELKWSDVGLTLLYGLFTLTRVLVLILIASLIWVPAGVFIGLRPRWAEAVQPIAQFLAAFPNNLFFPVVVLGIVHFHGLPDIWLSPLMILGTQWYILFNVIAGASAFPNDLREAAASFKVRGLNWWRKVALPGVFPYFVTGAITASGGSWNASIVAEVAVWGSTRLEAHGLGAYIADATAKGDMQRVVLGVAVMSIFVVLLNRLVWRRLFDFASRRLALN